MLELKTKEVKDLMSVVGVFKANGYEVNTYVQWADKVGGEIPHFTVEVPGITPNAQWLPIVSKHTRQAIQSLGRNSHG